MSAPVVTLNCTVGEIEEQLAKGVTVEQIARDLQEPRQNVVAVWNRWRENNGHVATPTPPRPTVVPAAALPSAPTLTLPGHRVDEGRITVDALAAAAARSASKRTQSLGVRLADLAKVVRDRLAEERATAEAAEAAKAEQEQARVEVERLEAQLRTARAKLRGRAAGGGSTPMQRDTSTRAPLTDAQRAQLAANREKNKGEWPCRKGCDRVFTYAGPRGVHEKSCGGAS